MGEALYEEYQNWAEKQEGFPGWPAILAQHGISGVLEDFERWLEREKKVDLYSRIET